MELKNIETGEFLITFIGDTEEEAIASFNQFNTEKQAEIWNRTHQELSEYFNQEEKIEHFVPSQPRPMPKHKTRPCGLEYLPKDSILHNPKFVKELSQDPKKKKSLEKIAGTLSNVSRLHELDEELYLTKKLKNHHYRYFPGINGLKYKFAQSNYNKVKSKIDNTDKTDFNIAKTRVATSKKGHVLRIFRDIDQGIVNAKRCSPQR